MRKIQTLYNSLNATQKTKVLKDLGCTVSCSNDTARKKEFAKLLKQKNLGYNKIKAVILANKD